MSTLSNLNSMSSDSFNPSPQAPAPSVQDLTRIFNTALVATRVESSRDFSAELYALVQSPAFRAILDSIRSLARDQKLGEREAAEAIVQTFRRVDRIWEDYILQEGVDRLKAQIGPS